MTTQNKNLSLAPSKFKEAVPDLLLTERETIRAFWAATVATGVTFLRSAHRHGTPAQVILQFAGTFLGICLAEIFLQWRRARRNLEGLPKA
jgi:uncharacterized protein YjeT (DUF2065 family)